ncbi:uncharacterized protein LOC120924701 isoform X2 [Rana temporaria]|uniref:uncharacterized protein LOC120924701 isoform X2 n=1 Tax=Rana temporaria TaxID=8407 RepID=UPI001AAD8057|nr:uncharacterized protein LOC120924701 isoform X2 [Rana temporaria]
MENLPIVSIVLCVSDPNATTVPASPPGTIYWSKPPTEPKEDLESGVPKEKRKDEQKATHSNRNGNKKTKNCDKNPNKKGCPNEGSRAGEEGVGEGRKREDGNREAGEGDGKDLDKRPNNGNAPLYTAITTFAVIAALTVVLLLLAAFCLHLWKKRIEQSTSKAGGASAQKLQEGDCEKKGVTVNAEATNSGNPVLPPVYNPTGHIYQEIADTPQNSAEDRHNPLYVPSQ